MARAEKPIPQTGKLADLATSLRELRRRRGLTYRQIASKANYSPAALSTAASGRELPSWPVTEAYARACGTAGAQLRGLRELWQQAADEAAQTVAAPPVPAVRHGHDGFGFLQFYVLGPVRASRGGLDLDLGGPKNRLLLAALLLRANRRVTVTRLSEVLNTGVYDNSPSRQVLYTRISRLRAVLMRTGVSLASVDGGYVLAVEDDRLDLARFEDGLKDARNLREAGELGQAAATYRQALDEWSGEPLDGVVGLGSIIDRECAALLELRRAAEVESTQITLELGLYAQAAATCQRLLTYKPHDEQVAALLMRTLHAMGRVDEALAVYRELRRSLVETLGVEPTQTIRAVHAAVLRGDLEQLRAQTAAPRP